MAGDRSDGTRDEPEANPFVAFRRFADEQLQAAFATLTGSSTLFRDSFFEKLHNEQQQTQRELWDRFEKSFQRSMNPERKEIERIDGAQGPETHHASDEGDRRPAASLGKCPALGAPDAISLGPSDAVQASEAAWTRDGMGRAWTFDFFDNSPYSPLQIEQDREMRKSKVNWRNAFEDLLVADAADYDPHAFHFLQGRDSSLDRMSGSQWKSALLQSGLLYSHGSWVDAFTGSPMEMLTRMMSSLHGIQIRFPQSELEFYETMAARDRETPYIQQAADSASSQKYEPRSKPDVLSTLTTTERRMQPDGSTTTRTVLRRRFSDGSEESEETSDSTPPTRPTLPPSPTARAGEKSVKVQQVAEQQEKRQGGGGWFW